MIDAEKWETTKIITVSLKDAVENLQATPTALDTVEPATSQIIRTIADADLPTVLVNGSPNIPFKTYVAFLCGAGQNTDTVDQTVYWRMLKNGSSVNTGSFTVPAGYYYTVNAYFYDVQAGDTIELRLWASATTVNWDYDAYHVQVTRLFPYPDERVIHHEGLEYQDVPVYSLGNPSIYTSYTPFIYNSKTTYPGRLLASTWNYGIESWGTEYGIYRLRMGDYSDANGVQRFTSATNRPIYIQNVHPTKILVREVKI